MKGRLLIILLSITVVTSVAFVVPVFAPDVADFTYTVGDYSSWGNPENVSNCATLYMYDDGVNIYFWVGVWKKPYLAWGELDKDGDHLIDPAANDENGDGVIDRYDLKSDGIKIKLECLATGAKVEYKWKVDSNTDGSPKDARDPEITVPSWDLNLNPGGVLDGKIVYYATIPIPTGCTSFKTTVEVHASPQNPGPPFVVPEVPLGTIAVAAAAFAALGMFALRKRKAKS